MLAPSLFPTSSPQGGVCGLTSHCQAYSPHSDLFQSWGLCQNPIPVSGDSVAQANPSQLWPLGGDTLDLPAGNEMIQVCKCFLLGDVGGLTNVFQGP